MEEIDEEILNDPGVFATDETVGSCETCLLYTSRCV